MWRYLDLGLGFRVELGHLEWDEGLGFRIQVSVGLRPSTRLPVYSSTRLLCNRPCVPGCAHNNPCKPQTPNPKGCFHDISLLPQQFTVSCAGSAARAPV